MNKSIYAETWDQYVKSFNSKEGVWPGDEWAGETFWKFCFQKLFVESGSAEWKHCVEIGAGSGKYTQYLLESFSAEIMPFDISSEFLGILKQRLEKYIAANRVHPKLLLGKNSAEMYNGILQQGWVRNLDAMYSIDAMVHVDFQYVMAYCNCRTHLESGWQACAVYGRRNRRIWL